MYLQYILVELNRSLSFTMNSKSQDMLSEGGKQAGRNRIGIEMLYAQLLFDWCEEEKDGSELGLSEYPATL